MTTTQASGKTVTNGASSAPRSAGLSPSKTTPPVRALVGKSISSAPPSSVSALPKLSGGCAPRPSIHPASSAPPAPDHSNEDVANTRAAIRAVIEEAIAPLLERIEEVERRWHVASERPTLPPAPDAAASPLPLPHLLTPAPASLVVPPPIAAFASTYSTPAPRTSPEDPMLAEQLDGVPLDALFNAERRRRNVVAGIVGAVVLGVGGLLGLLALAS